MKTLLIDIETAPTLAWVWQLYEANAVGVEKSWYILSVAFKWLGDDKIQTLSLPDFSTYKTSKENDKMLLGAIWKLLDEADVIIAHNGDRFDLPKINARLLVNGFAPPSPYKTIDTLKIARNKFKFDSNRLDALARTLGFGRKLPHTGFDLWKGCMAGDKKSWKLMCDYNAHDVELLETLYLRIRAWATTHPNKNVYDGGNGCPRCGGHRMEKRGIQYTATSMKQRYHCLKKDCGAWSSGKSEPIPGLEIR